MVRVDKVLCNFTSISLSTSTCLCNHCKRRLWLYDIHLVLFLTSILSLFCVIPSYESKKNFTDILANNHNQIYEFRHRLAVSFLIYYHHKKDIWGSPYHRHHMKDHIIFLIPATLLMMVVVTALPAFASNSDYTGPSWGPITGNPFQNNGGETKTHSNPRGDVIRAPEDTETHTPNLCVIRAN